VYLFHLGPTSSLIELSICETVVVKALDPVQLTETTSMNLMSEAATELRGKRLSAIKRVKEVR